MSTPPAFAFKPVHMALLEASSKVKLFRYYSVDVNAKVSMSPMFLACAMGSYKKAKDLFRIGASIHNDKDVLVQAAASESDAETKCKLIEPLLA
jgi:hypothetical protein